MDKENVFLMDRNTTVFYNKIFFLCCEDHNRCTISCIESTMWRINNLENFPRQTCTVVAKQLQYVCYGTYHIFAHGRLQFLFSKSNEIMLMLMLSTENKNLIIHPACFGDQILCSIINLKIVINNQIFNFMEIVI